MSADSELFNDLMRQVQHCARLSCKMKAEDEAKDVLRRLAQCVRDKFMAADIADYIENLGR